MIMVELDGLEKAMEEELGERVESLGKETIERWVEAANNHLLNATPPGTAKQDDWNMEPIAESVEIRRRRGSGGQFAEGWVAEWTAEGTDGEPLAPIFEFGAEPHDIEGNPVLAWRDEETGEMVFREKVQHPGIPAVAFIRFGKRQIEVALERGEFGA